MGLRITVVCFSLAALCFQLTLCDNWALLVAGSEGYDNYRHQADVCHAYHILRSHGIPQENIVTMMVDDIAYNEENPIQGNIINQPNGPNVYPGVVIDYKKRDVTPAVFLAVLSGDEAQVKKLTGKDGKVIKSGPDDHVFVNFVDHGATGIVAFPRGTLSARKLMKTIKKMHEKKSYKKLVLYVEACESGSMFYKLLPDDINVFASTAANRSQSSYACYYDKKRETYLGDVYSVNWMQDSDKENLETETLQTQFMITRKETNTSQVKEYGDLSISKMTVAEFQGDQTADSPVQPPTQHPGEDAVPAREAVFYTLQRRLAAARTPQKKRELAQKIEDLLEHNAEVDKLFWDIVEWLEKLEAAVADGKDGDVLHFSSEQSYLSVKEERQEVTQWDCYEGAVDTLMAACPKLRLTQDYHAMGQLYMLANLCERGHSEDRVAAAVVDAALTNPQLCAHA